MHAHTTEVTNIFSQEVSQSAAFGSRQRSIISGSVTKDTATLMKIIDIHPYLTLVPITMALDQRLWTHLPNRQTYTSLGISFKLSNLERTLSQYADEIPLRCVSVSIVNIPLYTLQK